MSEELVQKDGLQEPESAPPTESLKDQTAAGSGTGNETQKAGYVPEESYKGLQRAAEKQKAKLETELAALRQKLEAQSTELEEAKLAVAEKANLEKAQGELSTSIQTLQAERDRLTRQLNHQKIVLAEFPDLAPLASYIPSAETDEDFKASAAAFQAALNQYVKLAVRGTFEGAAPPIGSGNESGNSDNLERMWADVYRLAGIPGKESEYEEAYAKLQTALKSQ